MTEHLVRRLLDESPEEKVIKVPTRGQVSCVNIFVHVDVMNLISVNVLLLSRGVVMYLLGLGVMLCFYIS